MSEGEKPYFPPPRAREPYRAGERVTPAEEPPPKRVVATLAEPPASKKAPQPAKDVAGLSVEKRIARDMALNNERANEWAKRTGISIAVRILVALLMLGVLSVASFLPRSIGTPVLIAGSIVGGVAVFVWRVKRLFRRIREKEGDW